MRQSTSPSIDTLAAEDRVHLRVCADVLWPQRQALALEWARRQVERTPEDFAYSDALAVLAQLNEGILSLVLTHVREDDLASLYDTYYASMCQLVEADLQLLPASSRISLRSLQSSAAISLAVIEEHLGPDRVREMLAYTKLAGQLLMVGTQAYSDCREVYLRRAGETGRRKDEFLATLSHELRNPLAPIRNAVGVLNQIEVAEPTLQWARELIDRQVGHLTRLVDDLLDVSRIAQGKMQLKTEVVELANVVARALETSQPLIDARRHELSVALPSVPVRLEADPVRLAQVVANLLNNAAKYTERGGRIWLLVTREGGEAVLRVRDTGVGIPSDMLAHVFDLFTQVNPAVGHSQGGLGIGLQVVRGIVELHGGRVEAHSPGPDRGSEFVVYLPILSAGAASPGARPAEPALRRGTPARRVLVVDDNIDTANSLAFLMKAKGNEVHTAYDGPTALELARLHHPDAVFLDLGMPLMDGHEVARRLRAQAELEGMLLVAVSGHGLPEDRRRCRESGFDYHLVKPVDPEALLTVLAHTRERADSGF
jgi:signal transduction histidine kinase/CheY-like chemotaxis protein